MNDRIMNYHIHHNPQDNVYTHNFPPALSQAAAEMFFREISYYVKQKHGFSPKKLFLTAALIEGKFIFHEVFFERSSKIKEFPMDKLDKIFLNKNGVVSRSAHSFNHAKMWYLKQITDSSPLIENLTPHEPTGHNALPLNSSTLSETTGKNTNKM